MDPIGQVDDQWGSKVSPLVTIFIIFNLFDIVKQVYFENCPWKLNRNGASKDREVLLARASEVAREVFNLFLARARAYGTVMSVCLSVCP